MAGRNPLAGQLLAALDRADAEAGKVVVAWRIHARHFRRLAADQRAAASLQPSAMPAMTRSATPFSSLPVAK